MSGKHGWKPPALVLIVLATSAAAAQERPDFSGRWILAEPQQPDSETPSELSVHQTIVQTTVRGEPMPPYVSRLSIDRRFDSGVRSESHAMGLGGQVPAPGDPQTPRVHHALRWEGAALVMERGSYTGPRPGTGVWTSRREVWSLDADGRLRVVVTRSSSTDPSTTVTEIYRRP